MSRSYKNVRPRKHFVYTVEDLMGLYKVSRNTVSNWVKEGLHPSDQLSPYVFNGSEVKQFHEAKRLTSRAILRTGEFKCLSCKGRVFPDPRTVTRLIIKNGGFGVWGSCPVCEGVLVKRVNETDCDRIWRCVNTNTSLASLDEGCDQVLAGIEKFCHSEGEIWYGVNDRILHDWSQYTGRWSEKTVSAKLAAIRQFEAFCEGTDFSKVTKKEVARFRDHLKAGVETCGSDQRGISTVRHQASHVKSFLEWLIEQKGYRGLDRTLPSYIELPKKFDAAVLSSNDKPCPTLDEAVQMVEGMPSKSIKQRRDRAMVSIAFLAALRADTITSLLIEHLDICNQVVVQNGRKSRTKNGKSRRIKFFPVSPIFSEIVVAWKEELQELGLSDRCALFPDDRFLARQVIQPRNDAVPAMSSTHAVATAFETASARLGKKYSPHSAKHLIGRLSFVICKSPEEQKAWSLNMGHESEEVTLRYYKQIPDERVFDIFEQFGDVSADTSDDKELMLRYHEHKLDRGTPEFARAERLVLERRYSEADVGES